MRGNPSGNLVPECEPRKGVSWRLTKLDAKSCREDSAGKPRHTVTCPRSIFYTKLLDVAQEENQKRYLKCTRGILGLRDSRPRLSGGPKTRHALECADGTIEIWQAVLAWTAESLP